jgi:hypothetical protein
MIKINFFPLTDGFRFLLLKEIIQDLSSYSLEKTNSKELIRLRSAMSGFEGLNLGSSIAIILWFLFCADTVERERLLQHLPTPTYISFEIYWYLLMTAVGLLALLNTFNTLPITEVSHLFSILFLASSWNLLWVYHHLRIAFASGILALVFAGLHLIVFIQTQYWYTIWVCFLVLHNWATFSFAREHYLTRLGSRATSRVESPGKRPNADVYILPSQNPNLLVSETKEEQYQKLLAEHKEKTSPV